MFIRTYKNHLLYHSDLFIKSFFLLIIFLNFVCATSVQADEVEENIITEQTEVPVTDGIDEGQFNNTEDSPAIQSTDKEAGKKSEIIDQNISDMFLFLDDPHDYISSGLEAMAQSIDYYFVETDETYKSTESYLILRGDLNFKEGGIIEENAKVDFRLRLPHTEKKLNLFFASPEENQPYDISTRSEDDSTETVAESDYVAGVKAESGDFLGWEYKPVLGANLGEKIDLFVRFRLIQEFEFKQWKVRWHETPFWFDSIGWGLDSYLEFNNQLDGNSLFRISTFAGWKKETGVTDLNHIYSMFHTLDEYRALSYYMGVYGVDIPKLHTTQFLLGLRYRTSIHRDYLFIELSPQIVYRKENRFAPEHSFLFRLEMIFKE